MIAITIEDLKPFVDDKDHKDDYVLVESILLDLLKSGEYNTKLLSWRKLTYDLTCQLAELQEGQLRPEQIYYIGALVHKTMCFYREKLDEAQL